MGALGGYTSSRYSKATHEGFERTATVRNILKHDARDALVLVLVRSRPAGIRCAASWTAFRREQPGPPC